MVLFDAEMPVGLAFEQAESSQQNGQRQTWLSPAEVGAGIHKDLAEFQKNSNSKEALREFIREACKEDLIQALHHNINADDGVNADGGVNANVNAPSEIVEYLIDRGLIKPPSRAGRIKPLPSAVRAAMRAEMADRRNIDGWKKKKLKGD
jgi:hypothetical protein